MASKEQEFRSTGEVVAMSLELESAPWPPQLLELWLVRA